MTRSRSRVQGRPVPAWLVPVLAGAVVALVGTFLPWLRSGAVWRSSYEVWRSADRLGVVDGAAAEALHLAWFLVPPAVGCQLVALALHRPGVVVVVGLALSAITGLGAVVALRAPLDTGLGPVVTLVGASTIVVGALGHRLAPRPSG